MAIKTQRKAKAPSESYKVGTARKARSSAPKRTSKPNGKHPLAAYEHLHIGIVEASPDGKYVDANEEFCRILGYSEKELLKLGIKDCTHEDDYALDIKLHEQLVAGKIPFYELEKRFVRKDGGIIWVELTRSLVQDEKGKPVCTMGVVIDISEHKHVERILRESVEHLRLATEAARMFKWEFDFQKQLYTLADNFMQVLGFSAGLFPQNSVETVRQLSPKEDVQAFSEAIAKAIENHTDLKSVQYRVINPEDGQVVWLEVNAKIVYDAQGNPQRIFGVAQNITENKQAEEALHESEARFRAIVKQATAGIVRKDAKGKLTFVNEAFCNMLGYPESELLGKMFWQFTYNEDIEENKRLFSRLMMEGIPFKLEKRLLRADGALIWVDLSVSPVMDADGKPKSAVAVEVDITGRKQAEEALQQLNLQLESRVQKRTGTIQAMNQSLRDEIAERKRIEDALRLSEATARASEEKLHTLFDLLPVGISFLDPDGRIIQMNSALLNILKLSKEQLSSQTYRSRKYMRVNGTPMPPTEFASARALAENRTVYNVETGILLEDGEVVWTSVSAAPVDVAGVGVVTVDITESKRAERALQESHGRLRVLSQRLVEVQEEERRALARELHDRVGQTLAALNINLIIINSQLSAEALQQIGARLDDSMKLVGETITLVRDVMTDLRPAVLDDYGLEAALESHLTGFTSRYDIKVMFEKPDRPIPRLGPSIEMTFLRIAQEALMNIARHAHAEHVNLSLRQEEGSICLTVQDDGTGIESWQDANRPGSHGLTIMRERAEAFGGTLKVRSVPRQGTTVEASIPFNSNEGQAKNQEERL